MSAPHPSTLSHEDLERLTGYQRTADIERWCEQNGVRYFRGRRGIWTTLDAVNAALGVARDTTEKARLSF
jgi:hypothetical protein